MRQLNQFFSIFYFLETKQNKTESIWPEASVKGKKKEWEVDFILTIQLTPPTKFPPVLRLEERISVGVGLWTPADTRYVHCTLQIECLESATFEKTNKNSCWDRKNVPCPQIIKSYTCLSVKREPLVNFYSLHVNSSVNSL